MRTEGRVDYDTFAQPPDDVRTRLKRLGLEIESLERENRLTITDWYTATLGQKSKEKFAHDSLKFSELSIYFSQTIMRGEPEPDHLYLADDDSTFARFNEEKAWVELELTRIIPGIKRRKAIGVMGIMKGIHSEWVYKRLEGASEVIVDFKVDETGPEARDLVRIRSSQFPSFDRRWHGIKISENFEVTLE